MGWVIGAAGVALAIGCGGGGGGGSSREDPSRANLLRLRTGILQYATDNDDILPLADWMDGIVPYLGTEGQSALRRPTAPAGSYGYALNSTLLGASTHSFASPDAVPMVFESTNLTRNATAAYPATGLARNGGVLTVYLSGRIDPPSRRKPTTEQQRAAGLSNVKQLAVGLVIYANDNDDQLPQSAWTDTIEPYLGLSRELIKSPSLPAGGFGYAFNQDLMGVRTTALDAPSAVPMVFDSDLTGRNAVGPYAVPNPPRRGGNSVAYADGSAKTLP